MARRGFKLDVAVDPVAVDPGYGASGAGVGYSGDSAAVEPPYGASGASEEVAVMTRGLTPERNAADAAWDEALGQYGPEERTAAEVYTLEI